MRWKEGSGDWITIKDLKDSYAVQLANYTLTNRIKDEPTFAWWVPYVVKKRDAIVCKVRSKY